MVVPSRGEAAFLEAAYCRSEVVLMVVPRAVADVVLMAVPTSLKMQLVAAVFQAEAAFLEAAY